MWIVDGGKIYVSKMRALGYPGFDDSLKTIFDKYYKECNNNKEYMEVTKKYKFNFKRYCRIVAGLRTSKCLGCSNNNAYSIDRIWGMSDCDYEILKQILPKDVRGFAMGAYLAEKCETK